MAVGILRVFLYKGIGLPILFWKSRKLTGSGKPSLKTSYHMVLYINVCLSLGLMLHSDVLAVSLKKEKSRVSWELIITWSVFSNKR